ncbi:hypothetical protein PVAP13_3NG099800 [Panicum virgatum]|uniref:Uncharacterized protein n=1 Tax=Panicum virgatum TaxID=38727 RepID=A0A8T0UDR1_PANVG|nr:hypothetical protein PVAP13_3NG099800 [Panicum virgatum]
MAVKIWANNCISSKASKKLYEKGFCGNYRMLLLVIKVGVLFPDVGGVLAFDILADDARIRRCYA